MASLTIPNACSNSAGEPVGTTSLPALSCNLKTTDEFVNSTAETTVNRVGDTIKTIAGLTAGVNDIIDNIEQIALARSQVSTPVTLAAGQSSVTIPGFNASLSAYYLSAPSGSDVPAYRLFAGEHYTVANTTTEEITLTSSFEAGSKVYAVSLDPAGNGVIASDWQFDDVSALQSAQGLANGVIVNVASLQSNYRIRAAGFTVNIGDKVLSTGQVAELQPDSNGAFSVLSFGATSGAASQDALFENAALRALAYAQQYTGSNNRGAVSVPNGLWFLDAKNATPAIWLLDAGAEFQNPANYTGNNVDNISYLNGNVIKLFARGDSVMQLGATDVEWLQDIRDSVIGTSVLTVVSGNGKVGILAASRTSDKSAASEGTIPVKAYMANDDEVQVGVGYGMYKESIRWPNAGTTFCEESNITTYGDIATVFPNQTIGNAAGVCANYWVGGPVGSGPLDGTATKVRTSAAFVYTGGSAFDGFGNRLGFDAIHVVLHDSLATSPEREVMRVPTETKYSYYSDTGVRRVYTEGINNSSNGEYNIVCRSIGGVDNKYIFKSAGFEPETTNTKNCGGSARRWQTIYLQNAPDVVSDITKKTSIADLTANELAAGLALARNVKMFKWIDEVTEKGDASAYLHTSVMAQEAWQILIDNGVDPTKYGFISNNSDGWSVMQSELSMLMCAALVKHQDLLEQRIAALENI